VEFTNYGDVSMMFVEGDGMFLYNGTDYQKVQDTGVLLPTTFIPSFSTILNKRQYVAGMEGERHVVYISDFNVEGAVDFADIYTFRMDLSGGSTYVADAMGFESEVVSIKKNKQGAYIFTKDEIQFINDTSQVEVGGVINTFSKPIAFGEGPVNHRSVVVAGSAIIFLTESNKIMALNYSENSPIQDLTDISHRSMGISRFMETLDETQDEAFGMFYPKERLVKFFVKSKGASFNDVCITMFVRQDGSIDFSIDTNKYFSGGFNRLGEVYTFGRVIPELYRDEYTTTDNGSEIVFERWSKEFDLNTPITRKEFRQVKMSGTIQLGRKATFKVLIDGKEYTPEIELDSSTLSASGGGGASYATATAATGSSTSSLTDLSHWKQVISRAMLRGKGKKIQIRIKSTGYGHFDIEHLEFKARGLSDGFIELSEKD